MTDKKKEINFDSIEKAWNWSKEQQAKPEEQVRKEARAIIGDGHKDGVVDASPAQNEDYIKKCLNLYHKKHPDDMLTPMLLYFIKVKGISYPAVALMMQKQGHPFITPNIVIEKEKLAIEKVMGALA